MSTGREERDYKMVHEHWERGERLQGGARALRERRETTGRCKSTQREERDYRMVHEHWERGKRLQDGARALIGERGCIRQ